MSVEVQDTIANEMDQVHPDFSFLFLDHCIRVLDNTAPETHEKFIKKFVERSRHMAKSARSSAFVEGTFYFISNLTSNFTLLDVEQLQTIPSLRQFLKRSKYYRPSEVAELFEDEGRPGIVSG